MDCLAAGSWLKENKRLSDSILDTSARGHRITWLTYFSCNLPIQIIWSTLTVRIAKHWRNAEMMQAIMASILVMKAIWFVWFAIKATGTKMPSVSRLWSLTASRKGSQTREERVSQAMPFTPRTRCTWPLGAWMRAKFVNIGAADCSMSPHGVSKCQIEKLRVPWSV